jgi:hypothetical protein
VRLRIGKILGARYFIFGTYTIIGPQAELTARMDSVEAGQIAEADSVSGDAQHLRDLSLQLAGKFLRPLDRFVAEQELHPPIRWQTATYCGGFFQPGFGRRTGGTVSDRDRSVHPRADALSRLPASPNRTGEVLGIGGPDRAVAIDAVMSVSFAIAGEPHHSSPSVELAAPRFGNSAAPASMFAAE